MKWGALANPSARRRPAEAALSGIAADKAAGTAYEIINQSIINSRLPFYCAFACSRNKCPAQASVPPSFPRNINFVWRAHQKSMLSQLKWGINLKGYKICISLDQVN